MAHDAMAKHLWFGADPGYQKLHPDMYQPVDLYQAAWFLNFNILICKIVIELVFWD